MLTDRWYRLDQFDTVFPTLDGKKKAELRGKCICRDCPTYNPCADGAGELLYCVLGESFRCITEDVGCICPSCPLVDELGLLDLTFCIRGSEAAQRYGEKIPRPG